MTHIHDPNWSLKGVRRFWKRNHKASSLRGHQLLSSYEASLNFLASSGMRITVHYLVEKWPEGHYHHCFPSHVVKCGKNDVFYIHSYYNFVHFYAHFIFYIELRLLKVDDSKGFIPVKVATLLHSRDATNFSPMAH